jgi:hypothetical protein
MRFRREELDTNLSFELAFKPNAQTKCDNKERRPALAI